MDDTGFHWATIITAILVPIIGGLIAVWWKVESRQDKKIETLQQTNGKEHKDLHDKIESNHHAIRDRLDNIWKHLSDK
jgi:hypothetical protein